MGVVIPYSTAFSAASNPTINYLGDSVAGTYTKYGRVSIGGLIFGINVIGNTYSPVDAVAFIHGADTTYVPLSAPETGYHYANWQAGSGSATMATEMVAELALDVYDIPSGGSRVDQLDNTGRRPNNLRQVHGRYVLRFNKDVAWTAHGVETYTTDSDDGSDPRFVSHTTSDHAESGTVSTWIDDGDHSLGRILIYDPADSGTEGGVPALMAYAEITSAIGAAPSATGSVSAGDASTVPVHTVAWNLFPQTWDESTWIRYTASGSSVTIWVPWNVADPEYGEWSFDGGAVLTFTSWPDWKAGIDALAEDWASVAKVVKGFFVCLPGDGTTVPTTATATPHSVAMQKHKNQTGPGDSTSPILSYLVGFHLDPDSKRDAATVPNFYGDYESCWVVPPSDDAPTWNSFAVSYGTANIVIDSMDTDRSAWVGVNIGTANDYEWVDTGLATPSAIVSGDRVVVVASDEAGASITRTFLSDWDDCAADPVAWAASTGSTYGAASGRKEWYLMMKKVRANSDVFNWMNRRWLKITGHMGSGTGAFTFRITADSVGIEDNWLPGAYGTGEGERNIEVTTSPQTIDFDMTFTATEASYYIDLAYAEHILGFPLSHVAGISFMDLEASNEYHFAGVELVMGTASTAGVVTEGTTGFKFWTGGGYSSDTAIIPIIDGMVGARQTIDTVAEYALRTIERRRLTTPPNYSPRDNDGTRDLADLADDVNAQQGLSATTPYSNSDYQLSRGSDTGWAIFIDAGMHAEGGYVSATVKMADVLVPVALHKTWVAKGIIGGIGLGVVLDSIHKWPASGEIITLEAGQDSSVWAIDVATTPPSDDNGAWVTTSLAQGGLRSVIDDTGHALPYYSGGHRATVAGVLDTSVAVTETLDLYNLNAALYMVAGVPGIKGNIVSMARWRNGNSIRARTTGG